MKKIGIIICDRYHTCAGGKCLRALRQREGAFARYGDEESSSSATPPAVVAPAATWSTPRPR